MLKKTSSEVTQSNLLRSSLLVSVLQLVSVMAAYAREMAMARQFGTSTEVDQFYVAFLLITIVPALAQNLLWAVFVSIFVRRRTEGGYGVAEFANVTMSYLLLLLLVATLAITLFPRSTIVWLAPGFSPTTVDKTSRLLFMLLPALMLMGINVQFMAVLNGLKRFGLATLSQALPSFGSLVAILSVGSRVGIASMAWGWTLGSLLQTALLGWYCWRAGYCFHFQLRPLRALTELIRLGFAYLCPSLAAMLLMLVDRSFASRLGEGAIATLNYGDKIFRIPMTVLTTSLFTVALSYLAEAASGGAVHQFREMVSFALRLAAFLLFPIAVLLAICRVPITSLAYQHGAFSSHDTLLVAATLVFFAPHVVVHGLWYIVERSLIALDGMRELILSSLVMVVVKLLASWLLYRAMGVAGIVLSTLLCFSSGLAINYCAILWRTGWRTSHADVSSVVHLAAAALAAGGVAVLVMNRTEILLISVAPALHNLAQLTMAATVGGTVYLLLCDWMKIPEARAFDRWMRRRVNLLRFAIGQTQ